MKDPRFQYAWYSAIQLEEKAKKKDHVVVHYSDYGGKEEVHKKYVRQPSDNMIVYGEYYKHFKASERVEVGCFIEDESYRTWFVATVLEVFKLFLFKKYLLIFNRVLQITSNSNM
jgi:hypothetical protein